MIDLLRREKQFAHLIGISCPITYALIEAPVVIVEKTKDMNKREITKKHFFEKSALENYFKDVEQKFNAAEDKKLKDDPQYQKQQWDGTALNPVSKQPITRAMVKDGKELLPLIEKYNQQQEALHKHKKQQNCLEKSNKSPLKSQNQQIFPIF